MLFATTRIRAEEDSYGRLWTGEGWVFGTGARWIGGRLGVVPMFICELKADVGGAFWEV